MGALRSWALAACCLVAGGPGAGLAAVGVGGSLALTSDDVYRGLSQTCGHPAAQGDLHLRTQGASLWTAFAGVWGSAGLGDGRCGSARELNAYAGYSRALTTDLSATLTYTHFAFPGGGNPYLYGQRYDYDQLGMSLSLKERLYLSIAWTPNALGHERHGEYVYRESKRHAFAYGAQWSQPLAAWVSLAAGVGYDRMTDPSGTGYGFWSLGLTHEAGPLEIDVGYFRTAARALRLFGRDSAGGRVSATVLWRF